jgi:hypothetical protein
MNKITDKIDEPIFKFLIGRAREDKLIDGGEMDEK